MQQALVNEELHEGITDGTVVNLLQAASEKA